MMLLANPVLWPALPFVLPYEASLAAMQVMKRVFDAVDRLER